MFVYQKNPVGFELYSQVLKKNFLLFQAICLTFLFQNRRGARGRSVIPSQFYKGGGGGRWGLASMEPLPFTHRHNLLFQLKPTMTSHLVTIVTDHHQLLVNKRSLIFPVTTPTVDLGQNIRKNCSFSFCYLFV